MRTSTCVRQMTSETKFKHNDPCKPCQHQTARRNRYQHCHRGSVEGEVSTIACVIPCDVNMRFHPQHMQAMPASDSPSQSVSTLPQGLSGRRSQYNCLCHPLRCQRAIPPATHASHASIRQPVAIGINTATRAQWKEKSVQLLVSSLVMSTCDSTRNTCKPCQHQTARRNRYQHRHRDSVEGEVSTIACVIPCDVNMRFHPQHMQAMPASDSPSQSVSTLPQGLSGRRSQYNCLCHPL